MNKKIAPNKPKKLRTFKNAQPFLFPSIVLGVVAILVTLILKSNLSHNEARASLSDIQLITIDVPNRPVLKGEQLKNVPLTKIKWPSSSDNSRFVKDGLTYFAYYAAFDLPAYAPIPVTSLLKTSSDVNAVVEKIPIGYRAITVKVDIESVVEGWAQTGNFVDVIVLRQSSDPEMGIEAKLIAENVKILAAGATVEAVSNSQSAAQAPQTVTLLVTQEDALKIRTAATVGKLTFALRGVDDKSPSTTISMNQKLLLGGAKNAVLGRGEKRALAKGPDGITYVLDNNSEWIRQLNSEAERGKRRIE